MRIITFPRFSNKKKIENPYQYLLYTAIEKKDNTVDNFHASHIFKKKYDIVHVHWPESNRLSKSFFLALRYFLGFNFLLLIAKIKGAKIIWTIHNLTPHEKKWPLLQSFHFAVFTRLVNGFIIMNDFTLVQLFSLYKSLKNKRYRKIKHGHYKDYYLNQTNKIEAKTKLRLPENTPVCLFFGQIRKYKGIEELISFFPKKDIMLIIAGSIKKSDIGYEESLRERIASDNIILINKFITDDDIQLYMNAADLIILPYKNILNSGSLLLALSFNKPILVSNSPSVEEFKNEYGNEWIMTFDTLTEETIINGLQNAKKTIENQIDLSAINWQIIAEQTIEFYRSV